MDIPNSFRATQNVLVDGIISYGRTQSFRSHMSFGSPDDGEFTDSDSDDIDDLEHDEAYLGRPRPRHTSSSSDASQTLDDNDEEDDDFDTPVLLMPPSSVSNPNPILAHPGPTPSASERSPLLQRQPSISFRDAPEVIASGHTVEQGYVPVSSAVQHHPDRSPELRPLKVKGSHASLGRKRSSGSMVAVEGEVKEGHDPVVGNSTFGQSLFNSIAILLGVGILSEPYAFASAGWILGTLITIGYGLLTCYTAKILAKLIHSSPALKTYSDIASHAFGPRFTPFTSLLFFIELYTVSVVLIVLFSDSLHAVVPSHSPDTYKWLAGLLLIPTAFMPLRIVSYTSLLSVFSTLFIGVVVLVDGLSKGEGEGSIWDPEPTSWGPRGAKALGGSFGIFMAGFAGHAVIPSIARDMQRPQDFGRMINWAFGVTTVVYALVGACGYLMFGDGVTDEISRDLLETPGYPQTFTRAGMWMLVVSPITKFALSSRPLNIMLEIIFDLEPPSFSSSQPVHTIKSRARRRSSGATSANGMGRGSMSGAALEGGVEALYYETRWERVRKGAGFVVERLGLILLIVLTSIVIPSFGAIMSLLGAFSAFTLCVIGPLAAEMVLNGRDMTRRRRWMNCVLLGASVAMGAWGTRSVVLDQVRS